MVSFLIHIISRLPFKLSLRMSLPDILQASNFLVNTFLPTICGTERIIHTKGKMIGAWKLLNSIKFSDVYGNKFYTVLIVAFSLDIQFVGQCCECFIWRIMETFSPGGNDGEELIRAFVQYAVLQHSKSYR